MSDTEQDKELEKGVWASLASQITHAINCTDPEHKRQDSCVDFTEKNFEQLMQLITADRKRVELGARIEEWKSMGDFLTKADKRALSREFLDLYRLHGERLKAEREEV